MGLLSRQKAQQKQLSAKSKKAHNSNALMTPPMWEVPTSDRPCVNGAWSPKKGSPTLLDLTVPTTPTSAQATKT
eukprot:1031071-Pelagomonas_calceolata.AAC.1